MRNHSATSNSTLKRNSTPHLTTKQKFPFRTLLKHRNCTISTSQLYEDTPLQRKSSISKNSNQSHNPINHKDTPTQEMSIKQYTQQMRCKLSQKHESKLEVNKKQNQVDDDKLSTRSNKSSFLLNTMSQSIVIKQKKQRMTIEELQKKVEELIAANFLKFKKQRSQIGLSKWLIITLESNLQKQLQNIIDNLTLLRQQTPDLEDQKLDTINHKIQIIENMIASETTESQILKNQYFSWTNQRSNTTSFSGKKVLERSQRVNGDGKLQLNRDIMQSQNRSSSFLEFASSSKISYKKPPKNYYLQHKKNKQQYAHSHQPIGRSSYSTQYLNYGLIPTYNYKPDQTKQFPDASTAVKASSYQQEYTEKLALTNNVNFKELDCYRDKFKNTNISFMNSSKKQYYEHTTKPLKRKPNSNRKTQNQKQIGEQNNKKIIPQTGYSLINLSTCGNFYKSQHHKQFIWHNAYSSQSQSINILLKSQIKDKQLLKMKANYKVTALRS